MKANLLFVFYLRNINVCVQVSVGYVSRTSESDGPASPSTPASPLSLPLLISGHEPHLRRYVCHGTTTILYDSLPACCASSTSTYTGETENNFFDLILKSYSTRKLNCSNDAFGYRKFCHSYATNHKECVILTI